MVKEKNTGYENIKLENVNITRYVKVKDAISELMNIIDVDKVKEEGSDRVLAALLQLIDANDEKLASEKIEGITDAIYKGNIFGHFFADGVKEEAIDILSKTTLLNDEERFIYIVNFYMPDDKDFTEVYSKCGKNIDKIIASYGLSENEDAQNLVYGRILEISKFFKKYNDEKERENIVAETQALAAVKDATDNPTMETIAAARTVVESVLNASVKEALLGQLKELEIGLTGEVSAFRAPTDDDLANLNGQETFELDDKKVPEEVGIPSGDEEALKEKGTVLEEKPVVVNVPVEGDLQAHEEGAVHSQETAEKDPLANDVMAQLKNLVSNSKNNEQRVGELEAAVALKMVEIEDLKKLVEESDKKLVSKDEMIKSQLEQISTLEASNTQQVDKISTLETSVKEKDNELFEANKRIQLKDSEIASKDKEIEMLTSTVESYKKSLGEIQQFIASNAAPTLENPSEGEKTI